MPDFLSTIRLPNYASAPATGLLKGQLYINTADNLFYYYNGTSWVALGLASNDAGGNVINSGTPSAGQLAAWTDATHIQGIADTTKQWDGGATGLTAATGRSSLGLVIGSNVQAWDADLDSWAATPRATGFDAWANSPSSSNLRALLTDENGTGAALFNGATSPDFTTGLTIGGAGTSGKILKGDGTRYSPSAETYAAPGTAGNQMVSDGTNWISQPSASVWTNASTAAQSIPAGADTYLTGSMITLPAGAWKAGGNYRCVFDMAKTANGTAAFSVNVRAGTTGTVAGDAIVFGYSSGTFQTAATDQARFEVLLNIRTIGTAATIICVVNIIRLNATATGFFNVAQQSFVGVGQATATFNANTATKFGVSFNGGASFGGTTQLVQAEYVQ